MEEPSDRIQSVSRALRVLEEVGQHPGGVNPKRVARRCGLRLSTTYHLLRTLAYEGYLRRLPSGDYTVGLAIADRFRDLLAALSGPVETTAVLDHLAATTLHSAYAASLVGGHVTVTGVAEGPRSPRIEDLVPGFHEAAHATALGKALLWTLSPSRRRSYLDEVGMRPFTANTLTASAALEAELAEQARTGVFVEECQYRPGVSCVAVVLDRDGGSGPLALGFSASAAHLPEVGPDLVESLRRGAADLGCTVRAGPAGPGARGPVGSPRGGRRVP